MRMTSDLHDEHNCLRGSNLIPNTIHYCWFGKKSLPFEVKKCIRSWQLHCPNYRIIRWDETNFDVTLHPFTKAAYEAKAWAFVSDYVRLKIIYEHGGIYLDTDVELLKNLDFLLHERGCVAIQQDRHLCNTGLGYAAVPHNPVVLEMLRSYDCVEFDISNLRNLACPWLNNQVIHSLGYRYCEDIVDLGDVKVYPCRFFDPIAPGAAQENLLCDETISIHHYANSWGSRWDVLRRKIIRALGVERVAQIKGRING